MATKIQIISVGKKHDDNYVLAIAEYQKRISHFATLEWKIIPSQDRQTPEQQKIAETEKISALIPENALVILLDERGDMTTSRKLAQQIEQASEAAKSIVFIIGGAYGVDASQLPKNVVVISFGRMVIAHQVMRLVLIEQIYRCLSITAGSKYHHD